jgi:S-adenosylmethionine synthetase
MLTFTLPAVVHVYVFANVFVLSVPNGPAFFYPYKTKIMFEKVNPGHPDKMADRLAGAVVDLVYERAGGLTKANPRVACEVMAGHGRVDVQIETSLGRLDLRADDLDPLIHRLFGERVEGNVLIAPQDPHLSDNQTHGLRCGDNGIFKGCPPTKEQKLLTAIAAEIYRWFPTDGKYIINAKPNGNGRTRETDFTICQSCIDGSDIGLDTVILNFEKEHADNGIYKLCGEWFLPHHYFITPLGPWTGGINVDCGCTNRKLGSDMGDGVTGGGLMGKDLSKADVSVNIVCYLKAVASGQVVTAICSIGDENVTFTYADGRRETERFADIVEQARLYIMTDCGGSFERFAEWGLVRSGAQV